MLGARRQNRAVRRPRKVLDRARVLVDRFSVQLLREERKMNLAEKGATRTEDRDDG